MKFIFSIKNDSARRLESRLRTWNLFVTFTRLTNFSCKPNFRCMILETIK